MICKYSKCDNEFEPKNANQIYCCTICITREWRDRNKSNIKQYSKNKYCLIGKRHDSIVNKLLKYYNSRYDIKKDLLKYLESSQKTSVKNLTLLYNMKVEGKI